MGIVSIIGAGMMGTALSWPLTDNGHKVSLVGTPLDEEIINRLLSTRIHPKLIRKIPESVTPYYCQDIDRALDDADCVVCGVSSFGFDWFMEVVGPRLKPNIPVIAVTKGLIEKENGNLEILPREMKHRLHKDLQDQISLNAIGGPCIAHELAARRQTGVVFCGDHLQPLIELQHLFGTNYYHIELSLDLVGVEVCAALKNAYALGVSFVFGWMDRYGADGLANWYNTQSLFFAQSCREMKRFLEVLGGHPDNVSGLPGAGDLYVTMFGGRTVRLGRLFGQGLSYAEAMKQLEGETLESIEILNRVVGALPKLEARNIVSLHDFPLLRYIYKVISGDSLGSVPWEEFINRESIEAPNLLS